LRISVIGLGYVGLPLAAGLSRHFEVTGYDIEPARVQELESGIDRTGEVDAEALRASPMKLTAEPEEMAGSDVFIVAVPTPVDDDDRPDLGLLRSACRTVGEVMAPGALVVFESTVYPGVTEDVCGPALEAASGLRCGEDFTLGYSPERANPGDRAHAVDRLTKVVAGQTQEVVDRLVVIYGAVTNANVFVAKDIRTAEAAKVIENAQRDINIAFINEVSQIFQKLGLSVQDVLEAARTKWNFLDFQPGLVGGHCIGVDPFYLAHCAHEIGHNPEIILAGRRINDRMGRYIADRIAAELAAAPGAKAEILVLGLTFKENVPDLRNTKVVDVIAGLRGHGHEVAVHDPLADAAEAQALYGVELIPSLTGGARYDCVIGAVAHSAYRSFGSETLAGFLKPAGLLADIKGMWRDVAIPEGYRRWEL
jgi:UDP-N-acetyl-D-galactosamine dehydrogenase